MQIRKTQAQTRIARRVHWRWVLLRIILGMRARATSLERMALNQAALAPLREETLSAAYFANTTSRRMLRPAIKNFLSAQRRPARCGLDVLPEPPAGTRQLRAFLCIVRRLFSE